MDALTLGSLIIFAFGVLANSPRAVSSSGIFYSSLRYSEKLALILPATDISLFSTSIPNGFANL